MPSASMAPGVQWLGVAVPLLLVAPMLRRSWQLNRAAGKRLKELEQLKKDWQARADRGEIPRTRAEAEGTTL